jgi:hypothetical protein
MPLGNIAPTIIHKHDKWLAHLFKRISTITANVNDNSVMCNKKKLLAGTEQYDRFFY